MDTISKAERSALMSRIRSQNTQPERKLRSLLHSLGYRFRLHRSDLPGKPDIVLPKHRKIILVHGCFWHGHSCQLASKPKTNPAYWMPKIESNRNRDERNSAALQQQGWAVLVLWECEIRKGDGLLTKIQKFMNR